MHMCTNAPDPKQAKDTVLLRMIISDNDDGPEQCGAVHSAAGGRIEPCFSPCCAWSPCPLRLSFLSLPRVSSPLPLSTNGCTKSNSLPPVAKSLSCFSILPHRLVPVEHCTVGLPSFLEPFPPLASICICLVASMVAWPGEGMWLGR